MSFKLSAVVPCFNEREVLPELRRRLSALPLFCSGELEVVAVDDGSSDGTWDILKAWASEERGVAAVRLDANRGVQQAMLCGAGAASGRAVAFLDADLQDPPELLERMLALLDEGGAWGVIGVKTRRSDQAPGLSRLKDAALSVLPYRRGEGDFCVLNREAVGRMLVLGGQNSPLRARRWRALEGRPRRYFPYERAAREHGSTKYGLGKLAALWWLNLRAAYLPGTLGDRPFRPAVAEVIRR